MSTASEILATIRGADAVTLKYGYAQWQRLGRRETFEPGHVLEERRDRNGRCARLVCSYADGSRLRFTWSPSADGRFEEVRRGK